MIKRFTITKLSLLFLIMLVSTVLLPIVKPATVHAVTGTDWKAGRIIDDVIFYNKDSMTPAQIQAFLDAKVPVCDRNRPSSNPSYQPPWTCLKEYQENITTKANNIGQFNPNGSPKSVSGGKSAAQIIWEVGQTYGINPQVLIVMLQKEQSLITDNWPWKVQYDKAMGYACPDTAPCDTQYYGFYNQVSSAAWQLKRYIQYPNNYNFKSGVTRYIQYSPNVACGGSNVFLENAATAALYNYTPYQPNAGALANLNGSADCGAYGNRNFWRYYNDWFGSTLAPSFAAQLTSQSAFPTLRPGEVANVSMSYKNMGTVPWWDDRKAASLGQFPIHLATALPTNRSSSFSATWTNSGRVSLTFTKVYESDGTTLATDQTVVNPGQIARYDFKFTVPTDFSPGVYREGFLPVREGTSSWYMGGSSWLDVTVLQPSIKLAFIGQSAYPLIKANETKEVYFDVKNIGSTTLYDNIGAPKGISPLNIATYNSINRPSVFADGWVNKARPTLSFDKVFESNGTTLSSTQHELRSGQIARYRFQLTTPTNYTKATTHREFFMPILEGAKNWNTGLSMWMDIVVPASENKLQYITQSNYPSIVAGASTNVFFKYKNVGTTTLYDGVESPTNINPLRIATYNPINRTSAFSENWASTNRPSIAFGAVYESDGSTLAANQHKATPGQIVQFNIPLKAAATMSSGTYREFFTPVLEGSINWYMGNVAWQDITVTN